MGYWRRPEEKGNIYLVMSVENALCMLIMVTFFHDT